MPENKATTFSQKWTRALQAFTKPMLQPILSMSDHAARFPKTYIVLTIVLSIAFMFVGFATNFTEDTSDDIWSPVGSKPVEHNEWIDKHSNFPKEARAAVLIVHRDGKNLFGNDVNDNSLALESTKRMFEALDELRETPRYDELCTTYSKYTSPITNQTTCQIVGISTFWNESTAVFQEQATSNEAVLETMSEKFYPTGGKVDFDQIIGYNGFDENDVLNSGKTYVTVVLLPADENGAFTEDFEDKMLDRILDLQDKWNNEAGNDFRVEIIAERSFEDEFSRALTKDLPLIPVVFVLMSVLCIFLFSKRDKVLSRSWLGFGAVVTVLLAILASFGFLFCLGVPFTSLTPLLPFILFGVGLDDAFIIYGAFGRTDASKTPRERIADTMNDIGNTILLTTLTSSLAFGLGAVSSIPAVRYLMMYAFPTIIIDFIFQVTFFVALIVIDQRRVDENRRDCCFCCTSKTSPEETSNKSQVHFADRLMARYADFLLKPAVKWTVIVLFTGLSGFFAWRTSKLTQHFDFTEVIPGDSYIQTWWDTYQDHYEANGVRAEVFFRDVNFADESIRSQMEAYVQELADMPYSGENEPFEFWLRDFNEFVDNDTTLQGMSFEEQIQLFLADPVNFDNFNEDIVLNEDGVMTASRTMIRLDNVDEQDVLETVDVLELQRSISKSQPINRGKSDWSFFMFSEDFLIWEFYKVSPDEVRLTAIVGTASVSFLALIFIPHWSAIFFVAPLAMILYIDLLGFTELCGIHVNPVMYISLVMSIGLMVDFLMHITLRYMELSGTSRQAKTKKTLETIGASVLIGGFSTLIGVSPLGLSSSEIFKTTFVIFFGLVLLGLLHGLILLPVLLSMCGPLESIMEVHDGEGKTIQREETVPSDSESKV
jgi:Niemann-Pick C1 protein